MAHQRNIIVLLTLLLVLVAQVVLSAGVSTHRVHHRAKSHGKAHASVKAVDGKEDDEDDSEDADDDKTDDSDDSADDDKDDAKDDAKVEAKAVVKTDAKADAKVDDADVDDKKEDADKTADATKKDLPKATMSFAKADAKADKDSDDDADDDDDDKTVATKPADKQLSVNLPHRAEDGSVSQESNLPLKSFHVEEAAEASTKRVLVSTFDHADAHVDAQDSMKDDVLTASYLTPEGRLTKARQALQDNLRQQAKITALMLDMQNETGFQRRVDGEQKTLANETQSPQLAIMLSGMRKEMRQFSRPFYLEHLATEQKRLKMEESILQDDLAAAEKNYGTGSQGWPNPGEKVVVAESAFRKPDFLQQNSSSHASVDPSKSAACAAVPVGVTLVLAGFFAA